MGPITKCWLAETGYFSWILRNAPRKITWHWLVLEQIYMAGSSPVSCGSGSNQIHEEEKSQFSIFYSSSKISACRLITYLWTRNISWIQPLSISGDEKMTSEYIITVVTGNRKGAGTDASVSLIIKGNILSKKPYGLFESWRLAFTREPKFWGVESI